MKNKLLTFAGALALLATLGHFYAKPLLAQVRASLVSNVDDPGRIPYQLLYEVVLNNRDCSNFACSIGQVPDVPAGKRLVITNISGRVVTTSDLIEPFVAAPVGPQIFLSTTFQGTHNGLNHFAFNQQTQVVINAGDAPHIAIFLGSVSPVGSAFMTLTGYMLDCTTGPCAAIIT